MGHSGILTFFFEFFIVVDCILDILAEEQGRDCGSVFIPRNGHDSSFIRPLLCKIESPRSIIGLSMDFAVVLVAFDVPQAQIPPTVTAPCLF